MTNSPTQSPTTPFDPVYYGVLALLLIGLLVFSLICCGVVAHAQNNRAASLAQRRVLEAKLKKATEDPQVPVKDIQELRDAIQNLNQGSLTADFADGIVVPATENAVSKDIGEFMYHSSLGRLLLLSTQRILLTVNLITSIVFSGLVVNYITTQVVPTFVNEAGGLLNIAVVLFLFLIFSGVLLTSLPYS